ncbi:MAG: peptidoglycan synthetase [Bacteroidetes bacterium]|nr:peptidoglycan synthetase [Bacteroidota bacterium]
MKLHFIAIGGSAMHNLAIALHKKGYEITGSDDEIFEPSKSRLAKYNLLPSKEGWDEKNIHDGLDAVILGMHARSDNPELLKAQKLGLKIYSYPEFLYEQSKNKKRVVIGGSHGKTTITAMILHVLQECGIKCDYMVGAQLSGFDVMVKLTNDAPIMILEGDEYLTSPIDRRPKFHVYMPDIALISGIAWDHINVFPTFENYTEQFLIFANLISDGGLLIYCSDDKDVKKVSELAKNTISKIPYSLPEYNIRNGITYLKSDTEEYPLMIFGKHNLLNLNGARLVCEQIGVNQKRFYKAISSFKGASKRLELVAKNETVSVFKDFAHSPSKLKATTMAVKEQYPERELVACLELHTFSSLNAEFLNEYRSSMNYADKAIVYFNPHTIAHKKLPSISTEQVRQAFGREDVIVYTNSETLQKYLLNQTWKNKNLLLMSSGNFDGIDFSEFAYKLLGL